uniref:THAP domain-containing protein 1 n=1 Tax=Sphaeramia orbicularis TaxID=375764 RepID=A0A673B3Q0_9TELE
MAECKAYGCTNNKRRNRGKHFFCVPRPIDSTRLELAKRWLHNIGTSYTIQTFPFGRNSVVCEDHFKPTCYKRNLQAELLGTKPLCRLKADAVPTEFGHKKSVPPTPITTKMESFVPCANINIS